MKSLTESKKKMTMERFLDKYALVAVFVVMVTVFSILSPSFLSFSNAVNVLLTAAPIGIATVGQAIVLMQGGEDISAGSAMYFAPVVCSFAMNKGMNVFVFVLIALAAGGVIGAINGTLVTKFKVVPLIATYGTLMLFRGAGLLLADQQTIIVSDEAVNGIATATLFGIPVLVLVFVFILVLAWFVLGYTPFGRQLYAIGNDQRSAEKIGINVNARRMIAYVICGALSGMAGLISCSQSSAITTSLGNGKAFTFIAAAVLGGVSLAGGKCRVFPHLIVGILIITAVETGLIMMNANPYLYQVVRGGLIALAVIIDSIHSRAELR